MYKNTSQKCHFIFSSFSTFWNFCPILISIEHDFTDYSFDQPPISNCLIFLKYNIIIIHIILIWLKQYLNVCEYIFGFQEYYFDFHDSTNLSLDQSPTSDCLISPKSGAAQFRSLRCPNLDVWQNFTRPRF